MYSKQKNRKAKAGLLLIASPRFKNLGEGLPHGTYGERKAMQVEEILGTLDFLDVIFPGIVYEREDASPVPWNDSIWKRRTSSSPSSSPGRKISHGYVSCATCPRCDDLRQRSQGANGLPRHARRGRLHRVPLLRNACRIARRVGIASSCRQKTRPHRHGIAGGGDRTHPDIRRQPPAYAACCGNRISDCWPITTRRCGPPISIPTRSSRKSVRRSISSPIRPTARSSTA